MPLLNTEERSWPVQEVARKFELDKLTNPDARQIAMEFGRLAALMIVRIRDDDALAGGLALLAEARDAFITVRS